MSSGATIGGETGKLKNKYEEENKYDELRQNLLEVNGWLAGDVCDRSFSLLIKTDP